MGHKLPEGFCPDQIMILVAPNATCSRAILLLSARCELGYNYIIVQLQCQDDGKEFKVLANVKSASCLFDSCLQKNSLDVRKICGIFIAAANWKYDLRVSSTSALNDKPIASIGVFHNLCRSLSSIAVYCSRENVFSSLFDVNRKTKNNWIEKMWLSNISKSRRNGEYWMDFSFMSSDGSNYVWSKLSNESEITTEERDSFVLGPLQLFPDDDPERTKILLGPLSSISDRFLTYVTQERRKIHLHNQTKQSEQPSIYCVSDCMIGAPTFTSGLLSQITQRLKGNEVSHVGLNSCPVLFLKLLLNDLFQ